MGMGNTGNGIPAPQGIWRPTGLGLAFPKIYERELDQSYGLSIGDMGV